MLMGIENTMYYTKAKVCMFIRIIKTIFQIIKTVSTSIASWIKINKY